MSAETIDYQSFLLRLWRVKPDGDEGGWRASLESVGSGELRGFTSLEALFNYLRQVTQAPAGAPERRVDGEEQ
jgi:hypothetical protein